LTRSWAANIDLNNLQVLHHLGIPLGGLATGMFVGFVRIRWRILITYQWMTMQLSILRRCVMILKMLKGTLIRKFGDGGAR
jgi:hypothetical protein